MLGRIAFYWIAAVGTMLLSTSPARAEWHEASSERFVIYADTRASDLEDFAIMLERYHRAMDIFLGFQVPVPSPSNRLTIYMVGSGRDMNRLTRRTNIAGFYLPQAEGSVAFSPNIRIRQGKRDFSLQVLLHEYAHHYLISASRFAMPRWVNEGAAEFFGSTQFPRSGDIEIGRPPYDRAGELTWLDNVTARELLDPQLYEASSRGRMDTFYASSWGLFHYLQFSPKRSGQFPAYLQALIQGADSKEAAEAVFGDLDQLDRELAEYLRSRQFSGKIIPPEDISIGRVSIRPLSEGHAEMMDVIIQSQSRAIASDAAGLVEEARGIADRFPTDARVQAALAKVEYDAGNDAQAAAAGDRAIKADPTLDQGYVQKGKALFRMAQESDSPEAAYAEAMQPFEKLNAIESDHTQPLIHYFRSFTARGANPPEAARHAIERATQLAPFDKRLAMQVAILKAREGQPRVASYLLAPVAANPHGGSLAAAAQRLMDYLNDIPDGQPVRISLPTDADNNTASKDTEEE